MYRAVLQLLRGRALAGLLGSAAIDGNEDAHTCSCICQQYGQLPGFLYWRLPSTACMHGQGLSPHAHGLHSAGWTVVELESFARVYVMLAWLQSLRLRPPDWLNYCCFAKGFVMTS
jgi:hypothetical protein